MNARARSSSRVIGEALAVGIVFAVACAPSAAFADFAPAIPSSSALAVPTLPVADVAPSIPSNVASGLVLGGLLFVLIGLAFIIATIALVSWLLLRHARKRHAETAPAPAAPAAAAPASAPPAPAPPDAEPPAGEPPTTAG